MKKRNRAIIATTLFAVAMNVNGCGLYCPPAEVEPTVEVNLAPEDYSNYVDTQAASDSSDEGDKASDKASDEASEDSADAASADDVEVQDGDAE